MDSKFSARISVFARRLPGIRVGFFFGGGSTLPGRFSRRRWNIRLMMMAMILRKRAYDANQSSFFLMRAAGECRVSRTRRIIKIVI